MSMSGLRLLGTLPAHPSPAPAPARLLCSGRSPTAQAVAFPRTSSPSSPFRPFTSTPGCVSGRALVCRLQANVFRVSHCQDMESNPFRVKWRLHASLSKTEDGFSSEQAEWQHKGPSFQEKTADIIQCYPWGALCRRFLERTLDLVWIPAKWLAIPVFVLSTINEFLYTLTMKKDICIPLGILVGFLLAKVVGGAAVDVMKESQQDGRATACWPLMLLGLFFLLLKLSSPYLPSWSAVFIPHMANAGLLKTFFQYRELSQPSLF